MKMFYRNELKSPLTYDEVDQNFKNFEDYYRYETGYKTVEIKSDNSDTFTLNIDEYKNYHIKCHVDLNLVIDYDRNKYENDIMKEITVSFNRTANASISVDGVKVIDDADSKLLKFSVFVSSVGYEVFIK